MRNINYFYLIFIIMIILHVLIIGSVRLFPFIDLPMHLATATINRYIENPENAFGEFFSIRNSFLQPNSFHFYFCSLKIFPSVEYANHLFYIFYIILLPISCLFFIKKLNGNQWYSLFSFLYLYNFSVGWGFTGFTLGIPIFLFSIGILYGFLIENNRNNTIILIILFILLYHVHALLLFYAIFITIIQILFFYRLNYKINLKKILFILPLLILFCLWLYYRASTTDGGESILLKLYQYYRFEYIKSLPDRFGLLYWDHFFLFPGTKGKLSGVVFSIFIILNACNYFQNLKTLIHKCLQKPAFIFSFIFLVGTVIIYFLIWSIKGFLIFSYYRFSVFIFIGLILLGSIITAQCEFTYKKIVGICFVIFIHFILWINYFTDFQKENIGFDRMFFSEPQKDDVLAGLIYHAHFRGQPIYMHFPNYYIIWKHGIAVNRFVEFPTPYPIQREVSFKRLPIAQEWLWSRQNYAGQYSHLDYLLLRGMPPEKDIHYFNDFKVIEKRAHWILLENYNLNVHDSTDSACEK